MEIFIGETLEIKNEQGSSVVVASKQLTLYSNDSAPADVEIDTSDFTEGRYSIVIMKSGKLVSNDILKVKSPLIGKTKKEQLIEMIRSIDTVIEYRLTNNEEAIQQMSINGKSFVYETLDSLMLARKKLLSSLNGIVQAENTKKGKSPIEVIKFRFRSAQ